MTLLTENCDRILAEGGGKKRGKLFFSLPLLYNCWYAKPKDTKFEGTAAAMESRTTLENSIIASPTSAGQEM